MQEASWFKRIQEMAFWSLMIMSAIVIGYYVPLAGVLFTGILAAPMIVFSVRYGLKLGIVLLAVATAAMSLLFGKEMGLAFFLEFGFMSQVLAYGLSRNIDKIKSIMAAFAVTILAVAAIVGVITFWGQINYSDYIKKGIETNISESLKTYDKMEIEKEQKELLKETAIAIKNFMFKAYSGVFAGVTFLIITANCFAAVFLLKRFGISAREEDSFSKIVFPEYLIWGFIAGAALIVFNRFSVIKSQIFYEIGLNLTIIFIVFYFVQGLAILFFWSKRINVPIFLKWLALFFVLIQPLFLLIITGAGLFDLWFDLRRIKQRTI